MFPQLKKVDNESGVVLFIMLMVAIVIMVISVGILTQSMNETNYAQQQVDQIVSEQLSKGVFWNAYSSAVGSMSNVGISTVVQGRNYQITLANLIATSNSTTNYSIVTNYDTF